MSHLTVIQISDSHLFANEQGRHAGVNVAENLRQIFNHLAAQTDIDAIVFTGDLSQDHSEQSYLLFKQLYQQAGLTLPIYMVKGNHDDGDLLQRHFTHPPFGFVKQAWIGHWQLLFLDSTTDSPAGALTASYLAQFDTLVDANLPTLVFVHHHAVPIGFFIDKHRLFAAEVFEHWLSGHANIKAVACGHVHCGASLALNHVRPGLNLYTCPATSIQFDPAIDGVAALPVGPSYRRLQLTADGDFCTEVIAV